MIFLKNHIQFVEQVGQDMICLPVAGKPLEKLNLGYRYFRHAERVQVAASICVGCTKLSKDYNVDVSVRFKDKSEQLNVPGISIGCIQILVI